VNKRKSGNDQNLEIASLAAPRVAGPAVTMRSHVTVHRLGRKYGKSVRLSPSAYDSDDNVLSFNISKLMQTMRERLNASLAEGMHRLNSRFGRLSRLLRLGSMS
jgi:hypothetical protein